MTPQEAVRRLDALTGADPEADHSAADDILSAFAPREVQAAYDAAESRANGWWYA